MVSASWYTFGIAVFASIGTFLFGFDTGIVTTTIAHPSWIAYMKHPNDGLTGLVVSIYLAGEACGAITQILIGDRLGRIRFLQFMSVVATIGTTIQTASVNISMFLFGRWAAGYAVGALVGTVPIYLSEISAPQTRGLIGGISGLGIVFGIMVANWVGFACSYAPYGAVQWRLPLAIQIPWGVLLFIGLSTFMPGSPRELVRKGKIDEARREFLKIRQHLHSHEVHEEFAFMRSQIQYEVQREGISYQEIWKLYRHRVSVSILTAVSTGLTGINVIQYYQTQLYKSLGIEAQTILCLTGVFGTVSFVSSALTLYHLPDRWGRRKMLLTGMILVVITLVYSAIMQREFQHTNNKVGKAFALLGIFLYAVGYYATINCVTWLYGAEILPVAIRSKVMGIAAFTHFSIGVAITEAGPRAFANIQQNYYYVFAGCSFVYIFLIYFYFPETKQKTLEEIAAAFNDRVVVVEEQEIVAEAIMIEGKADDAGAVHFQHQENAEPSTAV